MSVFVIIENSAIVNRITSETISDIILKEGQTVYEAITPWDGYIGQMVTVDGIIPDPDPGPPPPPDRCSMRQARLALLAAGHLTNVDTAIALESEASRIEWEFGTVVMRDHPLVLSVLPSLGLTDADIDNLFIQAQIY